MSMELQELTTLYGSGLSQYLDGAGELALKRAYDLGRLLIESGYGGIELARVHHETLARLFESTDNPEEMVKTTQLASNYFAESLSSLEMVYRGFRSALDTVRASEERYRLLVETARDVIYTLALDGTITSLNPAFEYISGWLQSEWIGKSFVPLLHPDDVQFGIKMFDSVIRGESPGLFEARVRRKSGEYLVAEFITNPRYENGKVVGTLGIGRDVTARKQAEDLLRKSEEGFRLIAENVDDLIVVVDTEGRRLYNSPSYIKILGDPEQLRGTDGFGDIHADDRDRIRAIFRRTVETGIGERAQYRFHAKDGTIRYIESQGSVIKNSEGKPDKVIVVARDVTERIRIDQEIRKNQKLLAAAQQIAHIGSWEWNVVSNRITWSDELIRIFGLEPSTFDATYEGYLQRIIPEDRVYANAVITNAFQTKRSFQFEHRILVPHGGIRTLDGRGEVIVDEQGNVVRMLGTAQDITERKQHEEERRSLAKRVIDVQEEERHRIARELHDDVCQRLTGMRFSIEDLGGGVRPDNRQARKRMKEVLKQVDLLIGEVRRMSSNLRPSALDDFGVVIAMRRLCEQHQSAHNVSVDFGADGSIPEHYEQPIEIALFRILQEALSNIAQHAGATNITVRLGQPDEKVVLEVVDNGKGFSPAEVASKKMIGHGFGLVSMRERSELLGGMFHVVSAPHEGTKIRVTIPCRNGN